MNLFADQNRETDMMQSSVLKFGKLIKHTKSGMLLASVRATA